MSCATSSAASSMSAGRSSTMWRLNLSAAYAGAGTGAIRGILVSEPHEKFVLAMRKLREADHYVHEWHEVLEAFAPLLSGRTGLTDEWRFNLARRFVRFLA